jgi:hypothetical protein
MGNIGAARDFFAGHCGIPRPSIAHYVTVIQDPDGDLAAISTCCDGVDEAVVMLSGALAAITGGVPLAPHTGAVIVQREDLRAVLPVVPDGIRQRFREALGEAPGGKGGDGG